MIRFLLIFSFLSFLQIVQAQNLSENGLVEGIWVTPEHAVPSKDWESQWIWLEDENKHMMLSRKTFVLEDLPEKAILKITATSQYRLYLNDQYLLQGPARSVAHHQSYDELDISQLLAIGINTIAVKVHYQPGKQSYHFKARPGLLTQLNLSFNDNEVILSSDKSWKVKADSSWDNSAPLINRFQDFVNDKVDFSNKIDGWQSRTFDDADWKQATLVARNVGWPTQQKNSLAGATTLPWINLIPRDLPYLKETTLLTSNLIQAKQIKNQSTDDIVPFTLKGSIDRHIKMPLNQNQPLILKSPKAGSDWLLLYDFGEIINGNPKLVIEGKKGTKVDILTAPFQIDGMFNHKILASEFKDQIVLSGNLDEWESTYFKPARYLALIINTDEKVKILQVGSKQLNYPFDRKGNMESSAAPWVKQYFDATDKTIKVCTTDAYTDNYRERRQYAQTGYYGAMGNYWIFGDSALQRRYLVQTAQEQDANGIMPAYAPLKSDDYMVILDSNLLWIRSLYQYYLFSGDLISTKNLLKSAYKLMELLDSFTDDYGLINNPPYPYWLDHSDLDRAGANFTLNAHYLGALEDFTQLLEWLDQDEALTFKNRAKLLRTSLKELFWNKKKGLFTDALLSSGQSIKYSEHANGLALAMKIGDESQTKSVVAHLLEDDPNKYIKKESGLTIVTPAMSYFLHKGIAEAGYVDASFDLLRRRFDHMLEAEHNGTLWEEWWLDGSGRSGRFDGNHTRSDAQTESAFIPALFAEFLLGIQPSKPGMKEMTINLPKSKIEKIESIIPAPMGALHVEWDSGQKRLLKMEIPEGMEVKLKTDSFKLPSGKSLVINGKKIKSDQKNQVLLKAGQWVVNY